MPILFLFLYLSSFFALETPKPIVRPNVLFIAVDDLNTMLGFMGDSLVHTPNLDRLAAKGTFFSNAHCQSPLCGPSRASIMTGLRPSTTGIYGMIDDNEIRSNNPSTKDIVFLPEYFGQEGYLTMGIGKLFHEFAPKGVFHEEGGREKGFGPAPSKRMVWDGIGTADPKKYGRTSTDWGPFPDNDEQMPDHRSVNWAIERLNRNYDKPFFLGVGLLRVHVPLHVPQKWFDLYKKADIKTRPYSSIDLEDVPEVAKAINDLPMMPSTQWAIENKEWENIILAYMACISFVDYEIGRLLDALENSAYQENTIVVLWSDHGYRLGEKGTFAKHALWDVATKVPLIFSGPNIPKGVEISEPVELLSLYPTLLDLAHLPAYPRNEGESLVPLFKGQKLIRKVALTTYGRNNTSVKSKTYNYIRYEDGTEEFYDHLKDPHEFDNQIRNPKYKSIIHKHRKYLPKTNAPWDQYSNYNFQPYFVDQKARSPVWAED